MIEVRLFATFREGRGKILFFDPADYKVAGEIVEKLEIPPAEVSILLVNGRHRDMGAPVSDGDIVALFPPVGGG